MINAAIIFLTKAEESLAGAESELANGRYNNCANRCYYASFQAAIAALQRAGFQARTGQWGHDFVQAEFVGQLINRRKSYPADLRDILSRNYKLREIADYAEVLISQTEAGRALRRARQFVEAIIFEGGQTP
jgi:uncharacterized protein (UPF0332 family)